MAIRKADFESMSEKVEAVARQYMPQDLSGNITAQIQRVDELLSILGKEVQAIEDRLSLILNQNTEPTADLSPPGYEQSEFANTVSDFATRLGYHIDRLKSITLRIDL